MVSRVPELGALSSWGVGEGAARPWMIGVLAATPSERGDEVNGAVAFQKDAV